MMENFGGWIEWGGGNCPVDADARVHYRFKDGVEDLGPIGTTDGVRAGNLTWYWINDLIDIAAYRIVDGGLGVADKLARYEAALREIAALQRGRGSIIAEVALNPAKGDG